MDSTQDMDDTIQDDSIQDDSMMENMEDKLEHLDDFNNETQLELLYHEIEHIMMHGVQPNEAWYQDRIKYIQAYQTIDWNDLAARSYQCDSKTYDAATNVIDHLEQLEDEWETYPTFNLCVYQRLM